MARHAVQITSKYRRGCRKSTTSFAAALATRRRSSRSKVRRGTRYSSAEMVHYANRGAPPRRSGRLARRNHHPRPQDRRLVAKSTERHSYFYPHVDHASASPVKGHAQAAEKGIPSLFRRIYHNPDGYERPSEFDFLTYFECDDEALPVFDQVMNSLRDFHQNPEWRYVEEGPIWRGRRVLRW